MQLTRMVLAIALAAVAGWQEAGAAQPAAERRAGSGDLDGKTFFGKEIRGKGEPENQIYIFAHGTFEARWWATAGLHPGAYTSRLEAEKVVFEAVTPGGLHPADTARWQGMVVGDKLTVHGVVRLRGRAPLEVSGSATLGDKPPLDMQLEELSKMVARYGPPERAEQLANQSRTVANIRNLTSALYAWLEDQVTGKKPVRRQRSPVRVAEGAPGVVHFQDYAPVSVERLRVMLVPEYLHDLETTDGWGRPLDIRVNEDQVLGSHVMCVRSPGRDGRYSGDSYHDGAFAEDDFDQDIVWCDGRFVRQPKRAKP